MANGHPDAAEYPLCRMWEEAGYVVQRINGQYATEALVLQVTAISVMHKGGGAEFKKLIKRLTDGS